MKLILAIGLLIFFISWFFIFFIFDSLIGTQMECVPEGNSVRCNFSELNMNIITGVILIMLFVTVDSIVFYALLRFLTPGSMVLRSRE